MEYTFNKLSKILKLNLDAQRDFLSSIAELTWVYPGLWASKLSCSILLSLLNVYSIDTKLNTKDKLNSKETKALFDHHKAYNRMHQAPFVLS